MLAALTVQLVGSFVPPAAGCRIYRRTEPQEPASAGFLLQVDLSASSRSATPGPMTFPRRSANAFATLSISVRSRACSSWANMGGHHLPVKDGRRQLWSHCISSRSASPIGPVSGAHAVAGRAVP